MSVEHHLFCLAEERCCKWGCWQYFCVFCSHVQLLSQSHTDISIPSLLSCCLPLPGCLPIIPPAWGWTGEVDSPARGAPKLLPLAGGSVQGHCTICWRACPLHGPCLCGQPRAGSTGFLVNAWLPAGLDGESPALCYRLCFQQGCAMSVPLIPSSPSQKRKKCPSEKKPKQTKAAQGWFVPGLLSLLFSHF